MSKKKPTRKIYAILIISALIAIIILRVLFKRNDNSYSENVSGQTSISNSDVEEDLYTIEKAVLAYSETHLDDSGSHLPGNLKELNIQVLHGTLNDYKYSSIQQSTNGGPTISYKICATFASRNPKLDSPGYESYFQYGSPEGYLYHDKGTQCFKNEYYKGSSHINLTNTN